MRIAQCHREGSGRKQMNKTIKSFMFIFLAVIVLAACGKQSDESTPAEISVRLKWPHGIQFAGLYLAEQQGFFEEENLSVMLLEAGKF
jgi:ABC-type nitrate/sulfonate/bicarbonate transport system substrate-binding protein